eukprot:3716528-Rhodomonas_salina.1
MLLAATSRLSVASPAHSPTASISSPTPSHPGAQACAGEVQRGLGHWEYPRIASEITWRVQLEL